MTAEIKMTKAPAQTLSAGVCVAFVDADDALRDQLRPVLQADGLESVWVSLTDFSSGYAALTALSELQASVIVYELGERHRQDPSRFEDFYVAANAQHRRLIIATLARWMEEEGVRGQPMAATPIASGTTVRLVAAIHRVLS